MLRPVEPLVVWKHCCSTELLAVGLDFRDLRTPDHNRGQTLRLDAAQTNLLPLQTEND